VQARNVIAHPTIVSCPPDIPDTVRAGDSVAAQTVR
jgi:hypothetical protein